MLDNYLNLGKERQKNENEKNLRKKIDYGTLLRAITKSSSFFIDDMYDIALAYHTLRDLCLLMSQSEERKKLIMEKGFLAKAYKVFMSTGNSSNRDTFISCYDSSNLIGTIIESTSRQHK